MSYLRRYNRAVLAFVVTTAVFLMGVPGITPVTAQTRWLQSDSGHFRIIFQEQDIQAAQRVASMGDRIMADAAAFMGYQPRERVPVVIYGATAEANGFFTSYPPHIALFTASPSGPWLGAATEDWLELVFVHELVHYLHLTQPIGLFGSAAPLFGPLTTSLSMLFMPGWMIEGPTVYAETALVPGGRGENPFFEIQHAAPVLEGEMYSYDQAGFSSAFAPGGRFYASGYLMVDHLLREHGDDALRELNRRFQNWPILGMRRAVRRTTGMRAPEFWDGVVQELEERWAYRQDLPLGELVSPDRDGDWYLPVRTERGLLTVARGPFQITGFYRYTTREDKDGGSHWELLAPVNPMDEWSWTVDRAGETAVVSQYVPNLEDTNGSFADLFVVDLARRGSDRGSSPAAGTRPAPYRRLTSGERLLHPALSPDGEQLVALQRRGSLNRLVRVDRESGELHPLLELPETTLYRPVFSPDGTVLAVAANTVGHQRVVLVDAATGRVLAQGPGVAPPGEVHQPRFVEAEAGLELWYGGAAIARPESQLLGLYRSTLTTSDDGVRIGPPHLVLEDRIAAHGGFPLDGQTVLYSSYSSRGFALRRAYAPQVVAQGAAPAAAPGTAAATTTTAPVIAAGAPGTVTPSLETSRYRDFPRPILWLPLVNLVAGSNAETLFEFGGLLLGASNLGRHEFQFTAFYNPTAQQPSGDFIWTWTPGATSWSLTAARDYQLSEAADATTTTVGVSLERPLWLDVAPGRRRFLYGQAEVEYENRTPSAREFLTTSAGLMWRRTGTSSARDILGPPGRDLAARIDLLAPVFSQPDWIVETTSQATMQLNPWRGRTGMIGAFQIAPAAYLTSSSATAALDRLPYRSEGISSLHNPADEAPLAWLLRMETRVPLGVMDAAWRGVATTGSAVALYLEQGGTFEAASPFSVIGTELTMDLLFNLLPLTVTTGVAFGTPHPDSDVSSTWRVYFRLGGPAVNR